jgi:hypothetical protein
MDGRVELQIQRPWNPPYHRRLVVGKVTEIKEINGINNEMLKPAYTHVKAFT